MAKEMIAMLLAGGQGSRLYALTQKLAKDADAGAEKETEKTDHRRCGSRCYCGICSEQNAYSGSASHGFGPLCTGRKY